MKISKLIHDLTEWMDECGDLDVVVITNGKIYEYVDTNVPSENSPLYVEGAE